VSASYKEHQTRSKIYISLFLTHFKLICYRESGVRESCTEGQKGFLGYTLTGILSLKVILFSERLVKKPQADRSRVLFQMVSLGIFHSLHSSGRTMTLGSTQLLTEMNTMGTS
jgi:hypothetical protein